MKFKELESGDKLYIFDNKSVTISVEEVVNVSAPKADDMMPSCMVVDIFLNNKVFTVRDTADICRNRDFIVSTNRSAILYELQAQKASDEAIIAREQAIREEISKLNAIICELSK